jgi:hypothetical protein
VRVKRIIAVTAGLAATGAVAGAGLGTLVMALGLLVLTGVFPRDLSLLGVSAFFGAGIGAVLAPVAAWSLLRYVPLGRAIGQTTLGAVLGALIGLVMGPFAAAIGSLVGFAAAAVRLRLTTPARKALPY